MGGKCLTYIGTEGRYLADLQRTDVTDRLREHVQTGDEVYLASANFSFFLQPLQDLWGLNGIIATNAEAAGGRLTGRISGRVCRGSDKVRMLEAALGAERLRASTCYADDEDSELLHVAGQAIRIT